MPEVSVSGGWWPRASRRSGRVIDWTAWGSLLILALQPLAAGTLPPVTLLHNTRHLWLPLLVPAFCLALVRRRYSALPAAVGIVIWIAGLPGWRPAPPPTEVEADLTVLTLNVGNQRSNPEDVVGVLAAVDADLVLLQEVGSHHEALGRQLAGRYEQQAWYPLGRRGKALLTRLPLREQELVGFADDAKALDATVEVAGRAVRVLNVHHRGWVGVVGRLSAGVRAVEGRATDLCRSGEIALVAGDFNSVPGSAVLRQLEDSCYSSAFEQGGTGAGFTFPVPWRYRGWPWGPLLRLDHVLHSPELEALRAQVGPDAGSDHLPVIAVLRFKP